MPRSASRSTSALTSALISAAIAVPSRTLVMHHPCCCAHGKWPGLLVSARPPARDWSKLLAGHAHAFPDSARNPGLPGLPSLAHRGSGQRLACMAALHGVWPLLSGGGWHSGNARRSRDAPTAACMRVELLFSAHPLLENQSIYSK